MIVLEELSRIFNLKECTLDFSGRNTELLESLRSGTGILEQDNKIFLLIDIHSSIWGILVLEGFGFKPDFLWLKFLAKVVSENLANEQIIEELKINNHHLLELSQNKSQLLSTVSHELRTPMANILGFAELLTKFNYEPELQKKYLLEIYYSSLRLSNLINNFLDLSRIEALGDFKLGHFEEVEIDYLAEQAWEELGSLHGEFEIEWRFDSKLPLVFCDNESIKRVLLNLFSNALKYARNAQNKKIICTITTLKSEILVSVEDFGPGIKKEEETKIFDKFYRSESADTEYISGTGLGLWISKEIIEKHLGTIWYEGSLGIGAKFCFTLPLEH